MRNAFTLIELLAVIVILSIIALIATPIVLNVVEGAQASARKSSVAGYADATKLAVVDYLLANEGSYPAMDQGFIDTIKLQGDQVVCKEVYFSPIYGVVLHECKVGSDNLLYYSGSGKTYTDSSDPTYQSIYENVKGTPVSYKEKILNGNDPEIDNGLVPVVFDGTNWKIADTTTKWYSYMEKQWANAVILNQGITDRTVGRILNMDIDITAMFVWIPRYEYQVGEKEQAIEIKFIDTNPTNHDRTYTIHPAFNFGGTEQKGIWIGKFETTGSAAKPTVKPDKGSLKKQKLSLQFKTAQLFNTGYGLTNLDSHITKNIEWGSIVYLTQSIYGRCTSSTECKEVALNSSSAYKTGCGPQGLDESKKSGALETNGETCNSYTTDLGKMASTTGNIYGIYDMSGGVCEYTMGVVDQAIARSGFTTLPDPKYIDHYVSSVDANLNNLGTKGDATNADGTEGWYGDTSIFVYDSFPWFMRGGSWAGEASTGIFSFDVHSGGADSLIGFRLALSK